MRDEGESSGGAACYLRPHQTGLADFPHPAFPNSLATRHAQVDKPARSGGLNPSRGSDIRLQNAVCCPRYGTFVQETVSCLERVRNSAGALGSTGVTPLPRYYDPLRLPRGPDGGYSFPPPVRSPPSHGLERPDGSLRFLDGSFDARCPLQPRRVLPLHLLVASRPVAGFARSGRIATLM